MTTQTANLAERLQIRERRDEDRATEVDIYNEAFPPDWHSTLEEMAAWEAMQGPDDIVLRLLAWDDGTAVGAARLMHITHHPPGRFELDIAVRPRFQHQGAGRKLYEWALQFACEKNASEIECGVRETMLWAVKSWLAEEGFEEVSRMRESELNVEEMGPNLEGEAEERARKACVELTTLDREDSPENRQKLWQLAVVTNRDIPFDTPHPDEPYDQFEVMLANPLLLPEALVIAKDGDRYAGFSILAKQKADRAFTWSTGVHPDYRGRGVARALKVAAAAHARRLGFKQMRTFNHNNNPAMLAVNIAMGYKPLPEVIFFLKKL